MEGALNTPKKMIACFSMIIIKIKFLMASKMRTNSSKITILRMKRKLRKGILPLLKRSMRLNTLIKSSMKIKIYLQHLKIITIILKRSLKIRKKIKVMIF